MTPETWQVLALLCFMASGAPIIWGSMKRYLQGDV